jgi:peptide/nickel transport system substrate-binding protein
MRLGGTRVLAVLAVAALLAAACKGSTTKPQKGSGDTFSYSTTSQVMIGWDPSTGYSNEIIAMNNMYETLTRYDPTTKKVDPLLATSWSSSGGGKTWTFHLRTGVKFHTGRTLTSTDVKASVERTMKLNQGAAYIWGPVKTVDTAGPDTVVFQLKYPAPLDLVSSADYAAYIFDTKASGSQDLGKWMAEGNDAGTGPYTVDQWNKGQEIELRLKSFPGYWGGWKGTHYRQAVFRVVQQPTTAAQLLRSGQVSLVERLTPQLWQTFDNQSGFRTTDAPSWQTLLAMLNTASGPLADPTVRKAVAEGIDYDGMITALHGAAAKLSGYVPPGLWGHFDDLPTTTYNPKDAAALLKKKGYGPGGKPMDLTLTYTQGDADEQLVASLIKSNLANLNVNVDVRGLAWPAQWSKAKSSDPKVHQDILVFYWWPDYADPYSWFINLFHTEDKPFFNLTYYSNPGLDKQIDGVESIAATDRSQAIETYRDMQKKLLDSLPAISLYTQVYQRAMLSSVGGFKENPAYPNVPFVYSLRPESTS